MEAQAARTTVKVFAVLSILLTVALLALGGVFIVAGAMIASGEVTDVGSDSALASVVFGIFSIICFAGALYYVITGIGLWRMRNWARILLLIGAWIDAALAVFLVFGSLAPFQLSSLVTGLVLLAVSAVVLWLFQFNDAVRAQFGVSAPVATPATQPAEAMMLSPKTATVESVVPAAAVAVGASEESAPVQKTVKKAIKKVVKKVAKKAAKKKK